MKKLKSVISLFVVVCLLCGTTVTVTHATNTNNNGGVLIADNDEDLPLGSFNETGKIETIEKPGYNSDADIQWRDETNGSNSGHDAMVEYACSGLDLTSNEKNIVKYAAVMVDKKYGQGVDKVIAFHGRGNYVANIRFVSNFLQHLRAGHSLNVSLKKAGEKFPQIVNMQVTTDDVIFTDNKTGTNNIIYCDTIKGSIGNSVKYTDGEIMCQMITGIKDIYNKMENKEGLYKESFGNLSKKKRELVFLGLALHMIGDAYSHRTIIPAYTVRNNLANVGLTAGTTHGDLFGNEFFTMYGKPLTEEYLNDVSVYAAGANPYRYGRLKICGRDNNRLRYREFFIEAVKRGVAEFQDIYRFAERDITYRYDDNSNFCKERYNDAKKACKRYTSAIITNYFQACDNFVTFNSGYICPIDSYVKLNNFKNYTSKAGTTVSSLIGISGNVANLWKIHSTEELV